MSTEQDNLPFLLIKQRLNRGDVVPFLGAGASIVSKQDSDEQAYPIGRELARMVAEMSGISEPDRESRFNDLAFSASYFQNVVGARSDLRDFLKDVFDVRAEPGPVHRFLAKVEKPLMILTTNYDDLIEQAFKEAGKPCHLIVYPADEREKRGMILHRKPDESTFHYVDPNRLAVPRDEIVIYKMHGTWALPPAEIAEGPRLANDDYFDDNRGTGHYVISEEDYTEFLANMPIPKLIETRMRRKRFLFLGYGLADWNFRVMLHKFGKYGSTHKREGGGFGADEQTRSWAIMRAPSDEERRLWGSKKVMVCDIDIDDAVHALSGGSV